MKLHWIRTYQRTILLVLGVLVVRDSLGYYDIWLGLPLLLVAVSLAGTLCVECAASVWHWLNSMVVSDKDAYYTQVVVREMQWCMIACVFAAGAVLHVNQCMWFIPLLCVLEARLVAVRFVCQWCALGADLVAMRFVYRYRSNPQRVVAGACTG